MKIDCIKTTPKIYVGTYAKYNAGSIAGKWMDLSEYTDYDSFVAACIQLHKNEADPEFMIQDYEGFPKALYYESGLPSKERFELIKQISELSEDESEALTVFSDYEEREDAELIETFRDRYQGKWETRKDFAENLAEECGYYDILEKASIPVAYFDAEAFARDLFMDGYWEKCGHVFSDN
jgi:antirestriction protein